MLIGEFGAMYLSNSFYRVLIDRKSHHDRSVILALYMHIVAARY